MTTFLPFTRSDLTDSATFSARIEALVHADLEETVCLDFSGLRLGSKMRLESRPLLILANVLLGAAGHVPVTLVLPDEDAARLAVLRSGLLFSLVNRARAADALSVHGLGSSDGARRWLDLWSNPWAPIQPHLGELFGPDPVPVDSAEILANPANAKKATRIVTELHLERRQLLQQQMADGLAGSWLRAVIPQTTSRGLKDARSTWCGLVASRVLGEPILNLSDHAMQRPPGAAPMFRKGHSLVLLARTDGGGEFSYPRLHMVVADNGYGIVSTLRPKLHEDPLAVELGITAESPASEVLRLALSHRAESIDDPGLSWARVTFGQTIKEADVTSQDISLQFTVLTGEKGSLVWATVPQSGEVADIRSGVLPGVPFTGTTVFAVVPMPHQPQGAAQERLTLSAPA